MLVQRWIHRNILAGRTPHYRSFAYGPGDSILRCAREHVGCRWLVKFDVRRFFESISEVRVYSVFRSVGYSALVSFELARICTRQTTARRGSRIPPRWLANPSKYPVIDVYKSRVLGHLPQGAPTSPMLANLVARQLDEDLQSLAERHQLVYTRYADDLAFSTGDAGFSKRSASDLAREVLVLLEKNGFLANTAKTVVVPPGARKMVLGLLVDGEVPRLPRGFRDRVTHHVWATERFGLADHVAHVGFRSLWGFRRHVEGLLSYAEMVDAEFAAPLRDRFRAAIATD
jgi:RNA-directed DNA polymerase